MAKKDKKEIHKLFFRFLKERGAFGTINTSKFYAKNMMPENYLSCCKMANASEKRKLKKEWVDFIEPHTHKVWARCYRRFCKNLRPELKDTLDRFLKQYDTNLSNVIKTTSSDDFYRYFVLSNYMYSYSHNILDIDEEWYRNAKKLFMQELK